MLLVQLGRRIRIGSAAHLRETCATRGRHFPIQPLQQFIRRFRFVAHQHHVATRIQRGFRALHDAARDSRAFHAQIVAEDAALETQLAAQDIFQPDRREPRRTAVHFWIDHMRRHHRSQTIVHHLPERNQVAHLDIDELALVNRNIQMRIGLHETMAGEMFAHRVHAALLQSKQ